ncbi:collagen alpha-1(VII) chain [Cyclospora cayetanensis]|uniref:Collagen alpha-1(VII) chain n=1 Tax=Cyclospora cayetanensis TaxID=88456 RepID=A0A6P6S0K0_9EIME|nr:collagen alpha-1(VII) chain [Cyclospora cayetanensis]
MLLAAAADPSMGQQQQQQQQPQPSEELQQLQLLFAARAPCPAADQVQQHQQQHDLGALCGGPSGAAAAAQQYLASAGPSGGPAPSMGGPSGGPSFVYHPPQGAPAPRPGGPIGGPSRLLLFIDGPTRPFALQESDIRSCVSAYGQVQNVVILRDRAAAEISFGPSSGLTACLQDLDGVTLEGIGVLRAVVLPPGISAAAALPESAADPPQQSQSFAGPAAAATTGPAASQWGPCTWMPHDPRQRPQNDSSLLPVQQQQPHTSTSGNAKRVCRLELVGLFGEEPAFSVAAAIQGANNSNIQYIIEQARHKIDIGIRGKPVNDAPVADRLHLTLSSDDAEAFDKALAMSEDLVQSVCDQFVSYCKDRHVPLAHPVGFRRHMYQQQPGSGAPGGGALIYMGATERIKAGTGGAQTAPQPPSQAAAAAAAAAAATAGGPLLPHMLPPGVLAPGPLPLAALAGPGLPGAPLGPLVPPGALGPGVLGPPPFLGPPFHPPANGEYEQRHRDRSRSRERGPPRDREVGYRGGSPRRGGPSGRQPRRGGGRGPSGRGPRGLDEGGGGP